MKRSHIIGVLLVIAAAIAANWLFGVDKVDGNTGLSRDGYDVVIEEDGSGTQYSGDREVRTFPEGTFAWDCRTMGNRICG
jgi:hypothetical protein